MSTPSDSPSGDPAHSTPSSEADDLLAECLRAPLSEQQAALEEACRAHPALEEELRRGFRLLQDLGLADLTSEDGGSASGVTRFQGQRFGDFELDEVIAEGGMGVVYRARQIGLERDVVVKLIRPELIHFPATRLRFMREAEAVAKFQHPGIAPILAFGEESGVSFIALERIDGEALDEVIDGRVSAADTQWIQQVVDMGVQVADALDHAHARGIVHRDVKPSNLLLDREGRVSLIDFGLHGLHGPEGSASDRLTREGSAPGTLLYMAPEQLESGAYDVRSEVYSLGATLYELLTLQPPFRGDSRSSTEQLIRRGRPTPITELNASVPRDLEAVIQKSLSVDPTRRYVDCAAFQLDLRNVLDRRPVAARPDGAFYRLRCWIRRQPALAAATGAAAALALVTPAVIIAQQISHAADLSRSLEEERQARLSAEDMSDFVIDLLESADPSLSRPTPDVAELLDRSAEKIDERLGPWPERRADVQSVVGRIYVSLGDFERGIDLLTASVATLEQAAAADEGAARAEALEGWEPLRRLVEARSSLAHALEESGRKGDAYRERGRLVGELKKVWPEDDWRPLLGRANWLRLATEIPEAELEGSERPAAEEVRDAHRAAVAAMENAKGLAPDTKASTYGWLGHRLLSEGQLLQGDVRSKLIEEARAAFKGCLDAMEKTDLAGSISEARARNGYGMALSFQGDLEGCEEQYRRMLAILAETAPPGQPNVNLGAASINVARLLEKRGKIDEAIQMLRDAKAIFDEGLPRDHSVAVSALANLAGTCFKAGRYDGLLSMYEELLPLQVETLPEASPLVTTSYERRGVLRAAAGDTEGAKEDLGRALERYRAELGEEAKPVVRVKKALAEL